MTTDTSTRPAAASGTFTIGGDLTVNRLGFGAMRITGEGIWGDPKDRGEAVKVLRRAVELGVDFIDTAEAYGPYVSEELIREALHPYDHVTIATKVGHARTGPGQWVPLGRPEFLRQGVETALRRLGVERIDLLQLHRIDPEVPAADQIGELRDLRSEGKIRHIGLSEVGVEEIEAAQQIAPIVSVQNLYNLTNRQSEAVLDHATEHDLAFIPWNPIAVGELARPGSVLDDIAAETGHQPAQLALAWLLRRSPVVLPIPGTGSVAHLEENLAAGPIELTDEQFVALTALV